ncbi:MAG: hypothetical protein ACTSW2_10290 [Alphaproteobacteria bacterium]
MSEKNELSGLVQTLSGVVARARTELEAGNLVDLTAVEAAVNELCGEATTLSSADGNSLRPRLLALMDDFGHLSRSIEARLVELKQELGDTGGRQNALRAYGKTPGSS